MRTVLAVVFVFTLVVQNDQLHRNRVSVSEIKQNSRGSPLFASGRVTFQDDLSPNATTSQFGTDLWVKNVSAKEILAFKIDFDLVSPYHAGGRIDYEQDYFFTPAALKPGSSIRLRQKPTTHEISPYRPGAPIKPSVEFHVVFVQFSDATSFGEISKVDSLKAERMSILDEMNSLLRACKTGQVPTVGENLATAFQDASAEPEKSVLTIELLRELQNTLKKRGLSSLERDITNRLKDADAHGRALGE